MSYQVVEGDPVFHRHVISGLWKENLPVWSEQIFTWFYNNNPIGSPVTWLIKEPREGRFVGCCSIYPRVIYVNGLRRTVAVATGFAVDNKHRVLGPAVKLQRAVVANYEQHGFDFILACPNKHSEPIFKRLKYKEVGQTQRWVKLLSFENKLKLALRNRFLSMVLETLLSSAVRLYDVFLHISHCRSFELRVLNSIPKNDQDFQSLWERSELTGQYHSCHRSADYLRWRYLEKPARKAEILVVRPKGQQIIVGYCTFYFDMASSVVEILDIFAVSTDALASTLVCLCALARGKKAKSVSLAVLGGAKIYTLLRRLGFVLREPAKKVFLMQRDSLALPGGDALTLEDSWLICRGDLDV